MSLESTDGSISTNLFHLFLLILIRWIKTSAWNLANSLVQQLAAPYYYLFWLGTWAFSKQMPKSMPTFNNAANPPKGKSPPRVTAKEDQRKPTPQDTHVTKWLRIHMTRNIVLSVHAAKPTMIRRLWPQNPAMLYNVASPSAAILYVIE